MLLIRADQDDLGDIGEVILGIWHSWTGDVRDVTRNCGHHIAEAPSQELTAALQEFISAAG